MSPFVLAYHGFPIDLFSRVFLVGTRAHGDKSNFLEYSTVKFNLVVSKLSKLRISNFRHKDRGVRMHTTTTIIIVCSRKGIHPSLYNFKCVQCIYTNARRRNKRGSAYSRIVYTYIIAIVLDNGLSILYEMSSSSSIKSEIFENCDASVGNKFKKQNFFNQTAAV